MIKSENEYEWEWVKMRMRMSMSENEMYWNNTSEMKMKWDGKERKGIEKEWNEKNWKMAVTLTDFVIVTVHLTQTTVDSWQLTVDSW